MGLFVYVVSLKASWKFAYPTIPESLVSRRYFASGLEASDVPDISAVESGSYGLGSFSSELHEDKRTVKNRTRNKAIIFFMLIFLLKIFNYK